ncbi:hypothetical protein RBB77_17475 [Tunturibacter psychrotolerans]|uniref:DoxX family protein n=1 Tax=Tunturiibacter psychrotolerans TaxID=3069686 RepID=A0AAU7ZLY8_9BACT
MNELLRAGRFFFAISMFCFGVEYFIYASGLKGPIPGPPWLPGSQVGALLTGAALIAVAVCITTEKLARLSAVLLGCALFLYVLFLQFPRLIAQPHSPDPWTSGFELLALMGGAFVLARIETPDGLRLEPANNSLSHLVPFGRVVFAVALVVFAVQHFQYAKFVATIVPAWIPARLFWAYFVGVAFIAAAVAIVARKMARTASILLGTIFFIWVVILHVPRVAANPRDGNEVTSLLVALAMSGVSFILAESFASDLSA